MQTVFEDWEEERRRKFRRMVGISAVVHAVLFLAFTVSPFSSRVSTLPGVVRVDLVAMAPPSAAPKASKKAPAPKAVPKPKPIPKPKPKPPVAEKKVLPKDPVAKPKPAAPPPPAPVQEELDYDDVLAQLRKNDSETFPEAATPPTPAARPGPAGGPGRLISPEEAAWRERARAYVLQSWVLAPGFRHEELLTVVEADLSRNGDVTGTQVVQRSGNPWFDESVERAVQKAGPLPPPPEAGSWQFRFSPRDLR